MANSKSVAILELISTGHTYEQILSIHSDFTYLDIFQAAEEALNAIIRGKSEYDERIKMIRDKYPRAYEKWANHEEESLTRFVREGLTIDEIAEALQRQPGAIKSRAMRLGLIT